MAFDPDPGFGGNDLTTHVTATLSRFSGSIALGSAISSGAILSGVVGGVTMLAGGGSLMFMSAEIQEASGSGNWIMDSTGMSDDFYNALLLTTATTAALGTIVSSVAHSFDIRSIQGIARYGDYYGMRFTTGAGKTRVLSFHTHSHTFKGPWVGTGNLRNIILIPGKHLGLLLDGSGGVYSILGKHDEERVS